MTSILALAFLESPKFISFSVIWQGFHLDLEGLGWECWHGSAPRRLLSLSGDEGRDREGQVFPLLHDLGLVRS
jgi:hypothetical protein